MVGTFVGGLVGVTDGGFVGEVVGVIVGVTVGTCEGVRVGTGSCSRTCINSSCVERSSCVVLSLIVVRLERLAWQVKWF